MPVISVDAVVCERNNFVISKKRCAQSGANLKVWDEICKKKLNKQYIKYDNQNK
jgi:hypothetical protein